MSSQRCWLCHGPPPEIPRDDHGGVKFQLVPDRLCDGHWAQVERDRIEWETSHPGGQHTNSCGCLTFNSVDAFRAHMGLPG